MDPEISAFVQPFEGAAKVLTERRRYPNDRRSIQAEGIHKTLPEMTVVGSFELILDDHGRAIGILGVNVETELSDGNLGGDDRETHAESLRQHVDVLRQPRGEVTGLRRPDVSRVRHPLET